MTTRPSWESTSGSTPTTSSTRTAGPTTSRPGGTSLTGTRSRSATPPPWAAPRAHRLRLRAYPGGKEPRGSFVRPGDHPGVVVGELVGDGHVDGRRSRADVERAARPRVAPVLREPEDVVGAARQPG